MEILSYIDMVIWHIVQSQHICPIVLNTALNHIMILNDENQAYFAAFSKKKIGQISSQKAMLSDNNKKCCTPEP